MQKALKTSKNRAKSAKYKKLTGKKVSHKLHKFLSCYKLIFPEYVLQNNIDKIIIAETIVTSFSKERYRTLDGEVLVKVFAERTIMNVLKGKTLNESLREQMRVLLLYKKEIKVLRKAMLIVLLDEILSTERLVFEIKQDIERGIKIKSVNLEKDLSSGFCYGLTKNKNLGLFLDRKQDITSMLDLLSIDLEDISHKLKILINLLIKCLP